MADARHRLPAFGNSAAFAMDEPPALMIGRSGRHGQVFGLVPSPRRREQCRRWRIVLEQRNRFDVFRAQSLGPSAQGRSSGPIPSEPATARMSTAPSLESRISPLASSACCARSAGKRADPVKKHTVLEALDAYKPKPKTRPARKRQRT
jgi:hypothetical protein